jgi:tRNA C32,U32 (ribose-2'-O)-methylase TrmJ
MKPLDDYIKENLERFNQEEPSPGHLERFELKLAETHKFMPVTTRYLLLKIAAAVMLGLVISYVAYREFTRLTNQNTFQQVIMSNPELQEAEQFYTGQLNIYYSRIQDLAFNNDPAEKEQVLNELKEMDKQVEAMKLDLIQNPDDERIVHAIINFYQVKIELMDTIITRAQHTTSSIL